MGVKFLRLFGSIARNEATETSDLDFLIEFTEDLNIAASFPHFASNTSPDAPCRDPPQNRTVLESSEVLHPASVEQRPHIKTQTIAA